MNEERMYTIIRYPIISEKSTMVADRAKQIVFEVSKDATKSEIKESVEKLFKVRVLSVQVLNVRGKEKRFGRTIGRQSDRRKAYIRLHKDDDIDFSQAVEA